MALEYVVTKRVFGFDDTKTEKYVAKSVRSGQMSFSKTCAKVSRLCGVHRKVVDLVVSGLVDMMAEDIDDGKSVQLGEFGIFRPTIKAKSADTAEGVTASNIVRKRIVFTPGKIFQRTLGEMSVTRAIPIRINGNRTEVVPVVTVVAEIRAVATKVVTAVWMKIH